jgi:P pilus assembly chaperone PapD
MPQIRKDSTLCFLIATGALLTSFASAQPPAQIALTPSRIEIDLDQGASTHAVRLLNLGDEPIDVKVSVVHWDLDEQNAVREIEPTEQSLDQWILLNPSQFKVPAGSSQTVRFAVRPRVRPEPGEHRAMIYFEQMQPLTENAVFRINFRVGVAVYGFAGDPTREGKLNQVRITTDSQRLQAMFDISNPGKIHVRLNGAYAIWRADAIPPAETIQMVADYGKPNVSVPTAVLAAGSLPTVPVLPGATRSIPLGLSHSLEPGSYVLAAAGRLGEEPFVQTTAFEIRPATAPVQRPTNPGVAENRGSQSQEEEAPSQGGSEETPEARPVGGRDIQWP